MLGYVYPLSLPLPKHIPNSFSISVDTSLFAVEALRHLPISQGWQRSGSLCIPLFHNEFSQREKGFQEHPAVLAWAAGTGCPCSLLLQEVKASGIQQTTWKSQAGTCMLCPLASNRQRKGTVFTSSASLCL